MKCSIIVWVVLFANLLSFTAFSQTDNEDELLGLPGDNLDLYAVLDLFQKSKTIEAFEKSLNDTATGINNLDLDLDNKIDFIKVTTEQKDEDFTFILQVDVTEKETQDVAVILLSKDKDENVTLQIVGDKDLYGKNYVIEPKPATPAVTPNPAYTGTDPVTESVPASTTVVVVESAPIVQYVYSPVYVPYYPPYHYGYYPPYFAAATVIAVGIYRHNNYYYHGPYHGGYGNTTVVVHNHNNYNNYNNNRNSSNTINHHNSNGDYNRGSASTRPSGGASASQQPSNRPSGGTTPSQKPSTRPSNGTSASQQPSTRQSGGASASQQPSTRQSNPSASTRQSNPSATQRQPSTNSYSGGGRSGGGSSGGASRGGGGRGGRR